MSPTMEPSSFQSRTAEGVSNEREPRHGGNCVSGRESIDSRSLRGMAMTNPTEAEFFGDASLQSGHKARGRKNAVQMTR